MPWVIQISVWKSVLSQMRPWTRHLSAWWDLRDLIKKSKDDVVLICLLNVWSFKHVSGGSVNTDAPHFINFFKYKNILLSSNLIANYQWTDTHTGSVYVFYASVCLVCEFPSLCCILNSPGLSQWRVSIINLLLWGTFQSSDCLAQCEFVLLKNDIKQYFFRSRLDSEKARSTLLWVRLFKVDMLAEKSLKAVH